jgi:hypothetical protein
MLLGKKQVSLPDANNTKQKTSPTEEYFKMTKFYDLVS